MTESVEGRTLGAYRIGARLGAGGIGAVYEATHVRTGRRYAIKVLLPESALEPNALRRFRREAEALARLGHASIVAVHDFDVTDDGIAFLVMDRLDGEDLAARLERGPLPLDTTLRIFDEIADALAAAHEAGILHRDLKPSNVFLARRPGAPERAVLLDFGLAKMADATESQRLTATGAAMGTPMYMSPEQAQGIEVDQRTDVYSLAAILFEMVTGAPPFMGPTVTAILAKVLTHPPPPLRSVHPAAPEVLDPVIRGALAKSPAERPPTVRAFKAQVLRSATAVAATTPLTAGRPSVPPTMLAQGQVTPSPGSAADHVAAATPATVTPPPREPSPAARSHPGRSARLAQWAGLAIGLTAGIGAVAWFALREPGDADAPTPIVPAEVRVAGPAIAEPPPDAASPPDASRTSDASPPADSSEAMRSAPTPATRRRAPSKSSRNALTAPPAILDQQPGASSGMASGAPPSGGAGSVATLRAIESNLAAARASATEGIARAQAKIERLAAALPAVAALRRNLGSARTRPPLCDRRALLEPLRRIPELEWNVQSLEGQLDRTCDIFDAWATPPPEVQARIDRLGERFARSRRDLERRREDVLPPDERDGLLAELDAVERAIAAADRFPCAAPEVRHLMRHATAIGARGAQPALEAGRAVDRICSMLRYPQLASAHRQLTQNVDRLEGVVHELIAAQRRVVEGLERARASYGAVP